MNAEQTCVRLKRAENAVWQTPFAAMILNVLLSQMTAPDAHERTKAYHLPVIPSEME